MPVPGRRLPVPPHVLALGAIVVLGAGLRFATIDLQSYRYDEAVTVARVLHPSLFDTMATVPHSESTPPLYYALAWLWAQPFGTGEAWLRSLSALAGTASIAVVYLAAVALGLRRRAGLVAAAIVAVSPVLVWFSQDARAYALVFLLTALSFLFFARLRGRWNRRDLACWTIFSALAIATHYFAAFIVVAEAAMLLGPRHPPRSRRIELSLALAAIAAGGLLILPIALRQRDNAHASWIAGEPLGPRIERAAAKLVGDDNGSEHGRRPAGPVPLGVPLALAAAALALLLARGDPRERRGAGVAAAVGIGAVALTLLLALLGSDYFDGRNLLPAFVPLTILLGAGFTVRRAGRVGLGLAAVFCLCALAFTLEIDRLPRLQREDLRNAAAEVGQLGPASAVVTVRHTASWPLAYYLGGRFATRSPLPLREIVLVGSVAAERRAGWLLPPAFRLVERRPVSYDFTLSRYRARQPVPVPLRVLEQGALVGGGPRASVIVPAPSSRPSSGGTVPAR